MDLWPGGYVIRSGRGGDPGGERIGAHVGSDRWIEIPPEVQAIYRQWRPTPLYRARRLEKALDTPAKIYYKYKGVSPTGSHKPNTAVPQAYYNKQQGVKRLTTETGAGQWGSSLAFVGALFDLEVEVYMVKISYQQKPYRRAMMESYGASVIASPSSATQAGRQILSRDPDSTGSLGIAIGEAIEKAVQDEQTKYALGSVLNHVLLHQTVIGQETRTQLEMAGDEPDIIIGCTGGGSNFAGIAFPFLGTELRGEQQRTIKFVAVEPAACPTLTKGKYSYDFGDTAHLTPLVKMHSLGSSFVPVRAAWRSHRISCWRSALSWNGTSHQSSGRVGFNCTYSLSPTGLFRCWSYLWPY